MKILLIFIFASFALCANNIENFISKKLTDLYPNMHVNQINIIKTSKLPKNFENYKLENIHIANNTLKREKGSLSATYIFGKKRRRVLYKFEIDATVNVLRANQYIQKGKTLTDDLVDFVNIKFTNFYQVPITAFHLNKYRARTTLQDGKILTIKHIQKVTALKRGDTVTARLRDGYIHVTFQATTLTDAYIGDVIKIKKDHQHFYKARVVSRSNVEIVD